MEKSENIYKVGKSQWKKWTVDGRNVFNDLYSTSLNNERIMNHPDTILLEDERWNTIAWNHAWLAADFISMRQKGTVKI
jgi:hypothetical protein